MAPSGLPLEQVKAMRGQGMDNNQIIQALQRDGYSATQVFDAMNQATIQPSSPGMMTMDQQNPFPPQQPAQGAPSPQGQGDPPKPGPGYATHPVEETVEAIIDEKWNELVKDITTIIEWKNQAQNTIVGIEQQFKDLKDQFDKLHKALIAKIGEYDKNILDVGAEVKAMEKVFSKVLPVFTENVAELSKIAKEMKGEKPEEEHHDEGPQQ
ncbi:hypothetical protein GF367_04875 [Candidatus Woesearchaeota archaeon]|nr:hypothetical protein [Candidatus Woesearchaeota archaeon]